MVYSLQVGQCSRWLSPSVTSVRKTVPLNKLLTGYGPRLCTGVATYTFPPAPAAAGAHADAYLVRAASSPDLAHS